MARPAKPFAHQGYYCTDRGGKRVKLCPIAAGESEAARVLTAIARPDETTVAIAFGKYLVHAKSYYKLPSGKASKEVADTAISFRELFAVAGGVPIAQLSLEHLKATREAMIAAKLSRGVINQRIGRIKRAAKWLAVEGVAPSIVAASLSLLPNLKAYRSDAPESPEVRAVEASIVAATLAKLGEPWASLVRLQWFGGLRPGEACGLLLAEVTVSDRDGGPGDTLTIDFGKRHKMAYRGRERIVPLGSQASLVLLPWLYRAARVKRPNVFQAAYRRTSKSSPDVMAYNHAIDRAATRAGVETWNPNQLRHAFATRARHAFGLEAAGAAIGHAKMSATEVYAERDRELAARVARGIG